MYENSFSDRSMGANHQFTVLADYIAEHDLENISINYDPHYDYVDGFSHANGLSAFHKDLLDLALEEEYLERLVPATEVVMRWYETRSDRELNLYRMMAGIAHDLIRTFFSNEVIVPYLTTTADVRWWIRQRINDLGLQELLSKGNRQQEIFLEEMQLGRTGNEILASILERGRAEGLRPRIYAHPIGPYGHGSGTGTGEHPLHVNTVYAMEFSVAADVPEWGGVEISMGLEEQAVVLETGTRLLDGYPRSLYLIW